MAISTIMSNLRSSRKSPDAEHRLLVVAVIACGLIPFVATSFSILYETVLNVSAPPVNRFDQPDVGSKIPAPVGTFEPPQAASGSGRVPAVSAETYLIESVLSEY
ncbi:MAG TPA: hypothetical protein V6D08_05175 [Candidatus Obscuribacterales bacterium]